MKTVNTKFFLYLVPFGMAVYLLDHYLRPLVGMMTAAIISGLLTLVLLIVYLVTSHQEGDERERLLQLQADSAALYIVIASLLVATIFDPHSDLAMAFWAVLGIAVIGRAIAFFYNRYK